MKRPFLIGMAIFLIVITGVIISANLDSQSYVRFLNTDSQKNDVNHSNVSGAEQVPFDSQSTFNPNILKNKQESQSVTFSQVISELESLKEDWQQQRPISDQKIHTLYDKLDALQTKKQINAFHALKAKQWLASLLSDSNSPLRKKVKEEAQRLYQQALTEIKQDEQAHQEDKQFLAYKEAESKIVREVLAKYPNDKEQAAAELQKELDKLRSKIYGVR